MKNLVKNIAEQLQTQIDIFLVQGIEYATVGDFKYSIEGETYQLKTYSHMSNSIYDKIACAYLKKNCKKLTEVIGDFRGAFDYQLGHFCLSQLKNELEVKKLKTKKN